MSEEKMFYEGIDFEVNTAKHVYQAVEKHTGRVMPNPTLQDMGWGEVRATKNGVLIICPKQGVVCPKVGADEAGRDTFYLDVVASPNMQPRLLKHKASETLINEWVIGNAFMSRAAIEANHRALKRGVINDISIEGFFDDIKFGFGNYHK